MTIDEAYAVLWCNHTKVDTQEGPSLVAPSFPPVAVSGKLT